MKKDDIFIPKRFKERLQNTETILKITENSTLNVSKSHTKLTTCKLIINRKPFKLQTRVSWSLID